MRKLLERSLRFIIRTEKKVSALDKLGTTVTRPAGSILATAFKRVNNFSFLGFEWVRPSFTSSEITDADPVQLKCSEPVLQSCRIAVPAQVLLLDDL
jgi:hypothetical protein